MDILSDGYTTNTIDFFLILKNPSGNAGLGDPSVAHIIVIGRHGKKARVYLNTNLHLFRLLFMVVSSFCCFENGQLKKGKPEISPSQQCQYWGLTRAECGCW